MDKKLLGNFIIAFPPSAYIMYTLVIKKPNTGIDWMAILIAIAIGLISHAIGTRIKNKDEVK